MRGFATILITCLAATGCAQTLSTRQLSDKMRTVEQTLASQVVTNKKISDSIISYNQRIASLNSIISLQASTIKTQAVVIESIRVLIDSCTYTMDPVYFLKIGKLLTLKK